ncbi:MAG: carbamoyl-phosphate synthase large chain, partial [Verrucomicrobiota bacterium]
HASTGTAKYFAENGLPVPVMLKIREGRPNVVDFIKNGEVKFILNTPSGQAPREDEVSIRSVAVAARIPVMTTLRGARASIQAIRAMIEHGYGVKSLQEHHS